MKVSRGHHFVPQGYLRNFTDPKKNHQLVSFDRAGSRFEVGTANVAKKRDFNTIRGANPPDVVENYYAEVDDKIAVALREVCITGDLTPQGLDVIIALMAILHVRSPKKRRMSGEFMAQVARQIMNLTVRDEKSYQSLLRQMRADGYVINDSIGYDGMRDFVKSGQYKVTTETEAHIEIELSVLPDIEIVLRQRNWCLLVAPEGSQFVCSDHPSNIFNTARGEGPFRLGLGLSRTEVFLPINPRLGLAGRFEEQPYKAHVDYITVAERNAGTIYNCLRQVYAFSDDFLYKRPSELVLEMKTGSDLLRDQHFLREPDSEP